MWWWWPGWPEICVFYQPFTFLITGHLCPASTTSSEMHLSWLRPFIDRKEIPMIFFSNIKSHWKCFCQGYVLAHMCKFLLGFTIIIVNVSIVLGSLFKSGLIFCGSQSDKVIRKVGPGANTLTFYNHHPPIYILHMSTICHLFSSSLFYKTKNFTPIINHHVIFWPNLSF